MCDIQTVCISCDSDRISYTKVTTHRPLYCCRVASFSEVCVDNVIVEDRLLPCRAAVDKIRKEKVSVGYGKKSKPRPLLLYCLLVVPRFAISPNFLLAIHQSINLSFVEVVLYCCSTSSIVQPTQKRAHKQARPHRVVGSGIELPRPSIDSIYS